MFDCTVFCYVSSPSTLRNNFLQVNCKAIFERVRNRRGPIVSKSDYYSMNIKEIFRFLIVKFEYFIHFSANQERVLIFFLYLKLVSYIYTSYGKIEMYS